MEAVEPIAVLIDADNVAASAAEEIISIANRLGEPIVRRAYGMVQCFSNPDGWLAMQRLYGIVARPQVSNVAHKNVADIALVIDAMTLLYNSSCKAICLVSNDSDFTALAARIREEGKIVYGIGTAKTPSGFRTACHQFFTLSANKATPPEQPKKLNHNICPRCGGKLVPSRTKSNEACRACPNCGGMTIKLSSLRNTFAQEGLDALLKRAKQQEQMGCVCPDCGSQMTLLKVSVDQKHVEIDVCGNCRAIWYDKDEFASLVPNDGLLLPTVSAGKAFRRDITAVLTADLRSGKLKCDTLDKLKNAMKNIYRIPVPDITPVIGTLQAQKIITVNSKTGAVMLCDKEAPKG